MPDRYCSTANRRLSGWTALMLGLPSLLVALWMAAPVISQVLLALFLAILLEPVVQLIQRTGLPRIVAILLILTGLLGLFLAFLLKLTALAPDMLQLSQRLPQLLNQQLQVICLWFQERGVPVTTSSLLSLIDYPRIVELFTRLASHISGLLGYLLVLFLVLLFMLYDVPSLKKRLARLDSRHQCHIDALSRSLNNLTHYMAIRTLTGILNGLIVWGVLKLYGFHFAFEWAILAFVMNYIPIIGSLLAAIPPLIQGIIVFGIGETFTLSIIFIIVNTVLGCILEPLLVGHKLNMSLTGQMLSLLFWQMLLGLPGAFLAIPLTFMLKQVFKSFKPQLFPAKQENTQGGDKIRYGSSRETV